MKKLGSIFHEIISEDLEYAHATTNGPESDKFEIGAEMNEGSESQVITAYHGSPQKIAKFSDEFVGGKEATDQEGPGIYFTTNVNETVGYASPNGYVYTVELRPSKMLSSKMAMNFEYLVPSVTKLIKSSPNWKGIAMGYSDDINEGLQELVYQFIGMGQSEKEVFVNLYHEVFKENPRLFVKGMVKLGYDALYLPAKDGGGHIVVYNPKIIKVVGQKQL